MSTSLHADQAPSRLGRPRALNEAKRREVCALVSRGCGIKEAARYVGCAPSTIHRERQANEKFRRRLARAKMKANLSPLRAMQQAMKTDWRAAAWFLERTQPEKFARRNHRAFTQKQANALINDITKILGQELASQHLIDRLATRIEAAVRYACHAHNDTRRTAAELDRAMHHHDKKTHRNLPPLASGASPNRPPQPPPTLAPHAADSTRPNPRGYRPEYVRMQKQAAMTKDIPPLLASGASPNLYPQNSTPSPAPRNPNVSELAAIDTHVQSPSISVPPPHS